MNNKNNILINKGILKGKNVIKLKTYYESDLKQEDFLNFFANFNLFKNDIYFLFSGNKQNVSLYVIFNSIDQNLLINTLLETFKFSDIEYNFELGNIKDINYLQLKEGTFINDNNNFFFKNILNFFNLFESNSLNIIIGLHKNVSIFDDFKNIFSKKVINAEENTMENKNINFSFSVDNNDIAKKVKTIIENNYNGIIKLKKAKYINSLKLKDLKYFIFFPNKDCFIEQFNFVEYKKLNGVSLQEEKQTFLGVNKFRGIEKNIYLSNEDKFRHTYIIGKTGVGKSTLLSNMIYEDIKNGKGLCLIDPHGDLVESTLKKIPLERKDDVILWDIDDLNFPIGIDLFSFESEADKNRIISGILGVFYKMFYYSWGPRLEYILRNALLTIIEIPNTTIIDLLRLLTEENYREKIIENLSDNVIKNFWINEFNKMSPKNREEAISPIINKVGQFLSSNIVRNIFCQKNPKLNIKEIMKNNKILLVNLSKGKIGEDNTNMIGSFIVTKIQIETMARANQSYEERKDFLLYIDEFQNFATKSFSTILSESRKYKLGIVIANQYISQIEEEITNAIFGNVGTIISFNIGVDDIDILSKQFKGIILPNDFLSLPKFNAYCRLCINGSSSDPFNIEIKMNNDINTNLIEYIKNNSILLYSIKKEDIINEIEPIKGKLKEKIEKVIQENKIDFNKFEELKVGEKMVGIIKLKYSYGLFVISNGVEGLLHKKKIIDENWKSLNIGDKINVKIETKEINKDTNEKKITWTQT